MPLYQAKYLVHFILILIKYFSWRKPYWWNLLEKNLHNLKCLGFAFVGKVMIWEIHYFANSQMKFSIVLGLVCKNVIYTYKLKWSFFYFRGPAKFLSSTPSFDTCSANLSALHDEGNKLFYCVLGSIFKLRRTLFEFLTELWSSFRLHCKLLAQAVVWDTNVI